MGNIVNSILDWNRMNKNIEQLKSFEQYCKEHPEERFWQALRSWSGYNFILASTASEIAINTEKTIDTFYLEG